MIFYSRDKHPSSTGVYLIGFIGSDKFYIGSASVNKYSQPHRNGFRLRWYYHLYNLRKNNNTSIKLQNAYNKYGEENMFFVVLEELKPNKCIESEQYWIDFFDSVNNGYNCAPTAGSCLGFKQSLSTRKKMSQTQNRLAIEKEEGYKDLVISMYSSGDSIIKITKMLNISDYLVKSILNRNNVRIRGHSEIRRKKIYVYSISGEFLSEHESTIACSKFYNCFKRNILRVAHKKVKRYKDKVFSFVKMKKKDVLEQVNTKPKKGRIWTQKEKDKLSKTITGTRKSIKYKNIKQIDKSGKVCNVYDTLSDAVDAIGVSAAHVISRCFNNHKTCKGYYWAAEIITKNQKKVQ